MDASALSRASTSLPLGGIFVAPGDSAALLLASLVGTAASRDAAAGEADRLREKIAAVVAEGARAAAEVESADATILELRKNLEAVVGEARSRDVRARSSSARKEAEIARLAAVSEASAAELRELRPRLRAGSGSLCGSWKRLDRRYPQPFRPACRPFDMAGMTWTVTFGCAWGHESRWLSPGCVCC